MVRNGKAKAAKSADPVPLTDAQQTLFERVSEKLSEVMAKIHGPRNVTTADIKALGAAAAELHKSLGESGTPVRHHKYMIENRGLKPDDPRFYEHVHPVQDLIKFIGNQAANDDPEDQTIGHEFDFTVYSRRWGHEDKYHVKRTKTGWTFTHVHGPTPTGKDGRVRAQPGTGLFDLLDHDAINYPEELPGYLEWLWDRAAEDGLSHEQVQHGVSTLAEWVNLVERNSPEGIFRGFK